MGRPILEACSEDLVKPGTVQNIGSENMNFQLSHVQGNEQCKFDLKIRN